MFYFGCVVSVWFEFIASSARTGGCLERGCDGVDGWGKTKVSLSVRKCRAFHLVAKKNCRIRHKLTISLQKG